MSIATLIAMDAAAARIAGELTRWGWLPDLAGDALPTDVVPLAGGSSHVYWLEGESESVDTATQTTFSILVAARMQPKVAGLVLRFAPELNDEAAAALTSYLQGLQAEGGAAASFFYIGGNDDDAERDN